MGMFDQFYSSFENAETGGINDPWIRTLDNRPPGSSAYGPVQITKGLVDSSESIGLFQGTSVQNFVDEYQKQGATFLYHGNEKGNIPDYDPTYDYGGAGHLTTPQDKSDYRAMADILIKDHWEQVKDTDRPIENLIKLWRWGPDALDIKHKDYKTVQDDKRYFREFIDPYENP